MGIDIRMWGKKFNLEKIVVIVFRGRISIKIFVFWYVVLFDIMGRG